MTLDACNQTRPCVDSAWAWTGAERCNGEYVEREYKSNCDNIDWRIERAVTWVDTGNYRCGATTTEVEQRNDCGNTRWISGVPFVWSDTGLTRCTATKVQKQQENQCKQVRWVDADDVQWVDTGKERCENFRVQREQRNQCGDMRWNTTTVKCGYCADVKLPSGGYAYSPNNTRKDPEATVALNTSNNIIGFIYPTPAGNNGLVVPVTIGGATCSACSPEQLLGYAATTCCAEMCDNQSGEGCKTCE